MSKTTQIVTCSILLGLSLVLVGVVAFSDTLDHYRHIGLIFFGSICAGAISAVQLRILIEDPNDNCVE